MTSGSPSSATSIEPGVSRVKEFGRQLINVYFYSAGTALFLVTLVWLVRAAMGEASPAAWQRSAGVLIVVLAGTMSLRLVRRLDSRATQDWTAFDGLLCLAGGLATANLAIRAGVWSGAALVLLFLVLEGSILWRLGLAPTKWYSRKVQEESDAPQLRLLAPTETARSSGAFTIETEAAAIDPEITQQLRRRETAEGIEVSGMIRGQFAENETQTSIDLAFCPTLTCEPVVQFEVNCEEVLDVQLAVLRTYGVRFDLKRKGVSQNSLAFELEIHVMAESSSVETPASRSPNENDA